MAGVACSSRVKYCATLVSTVIVDESAKRTYVAFEVTGLLDAIEI